MKMKIKVALIAIALLSGFARPSQAQQPIDLGQLWLDLIAKSFEQHAGKPDPIQRVCDNDGCWAWWMPVTYNNAQYTVQYAKIGKYSASLICRELPAEQYCVNVDTGEQSIYNR